jgi:hypothetical protein
MRLTRKFLVVCMAVVPAALGISFAVPAVPAQAASCLNTPVAVYNATYPTYFAQAGGVNGEAYYQEIKATSFCPVTEKSVNGESQFQYKDSYGYCATAITDGPVYEAPCNDYPASQDWHYYYSASTDDGTIMNYYTGTCWWFVGPDFNDPINSGGCKLNQNNALDEEDDS